MQLPTLQLDELLKKEMSRKEFMQHIGVILLGAAGITALISRLTSHQLNQTNLPAQSSGYGARTYGR